jgi:hypothetical protein
MRKLVLISALLLASVSAQAGETRSLSLAGIPTITAAGTSPTEAPQPMAQLSVRLAQAATIASDAAPIQVQAPAAAPVQAQAPAAMQTTAAPPATATTTTTMPTTSETKPATKKTVKKVRRESDEAKARRIAAKYGVYW